MRIRTALLSAIVMGVLAGCGSSATVVPKPATGITHSVLPWIDTPGDSMTPPVIIPTPRPATACVPSSLRLTNLDILWQFTGGGNGAYFSVKNVSTQACRLSGYLPVTVDGRAVTHGSNFFGIEAGNLAPEQAGQFGFVQDNTQTGAIVRCERKAKPLLREPVALAGHHVGTVAINRCFDLWMSPAGVAAPDLPPMSSDPVGYLTASVSGPSKAVAGHIFHVTITLTNPTATTVHLSPCPSYTVGVYPGPTLVYKLNCAVGTIGPGKSQSYDMQYPIAGSTPAGSSKFVWMLVNKMPVGAGRELTVVG